MMICMISGFDVDSSKDREREIYGTHTLVQTLRI
jgi:hypothetical protein